MKLNRSKLAIAISYSLVFVSFLIFSTQTITAQDSKIALQRGYRTGYSDGYMAGYRDAMENAARSYSNHPEYGKGDRAYAKEYGSLEDYRDGYQQGFEAGYDTGFDKKSFDATLPSDLRKRGTINTASNTPSNDNADNPPVLTQKQIPAATVATSGEQIVIIPSDTELIVELLGDINTMQSREGDKFQARVVSPLEIAGAIVEGRVSKITQPGRIKRRAQLSLTFDTIRLTETRWSNFSAVLTEVLPVKGDNVKKVDTEGTVIGKSTVKKDSITVGGSTAAGAGVGAVVGGPVGAAVGAGVGAAFGVGAVVVERGKHVKIITGQQLRLKTGLEAQIR